MLLAVVLVGFAAISEAAPRSRSKGPQLVYDQKQHGDYNIQVHLKDFQIIALLGEESLGGLGDYDYNYDYSDYTVKPSGSSSTAKPAIDISTTTLKSSEVYASSKKPLDVPVITSKPNNEEVNSSKPSQSEKPLELSSGTKPDEAKPSSDASTPTKDQLVSTTEKLSGTTKEYPEPLAENDVPGQIQVQVIQSPDGYQNFTEKKDKTEDSSGKSNDRKCSSGFSRDKRGRCRRVRRPQSALPFNFGRLANLAKRFRSNDKDSSQKVPPAIILQPSESHGDQ